MKNKWLIGLVVVLLIVVIFQAAYILTLKTMENMSFTGRAISSGNQPNEVRVYYIPQPQQPAMVVGRNFAGNDNFDPFADMRRMQAQMDRDFNDNFSRVNDLMSQEPVTAAKEFFQPSLDVQNLVDSYLVKVDLPGLKKEDIKVEVKDRYLVISGERKSQEEAKDKNYYRKEINMGSFMRSVYLPLDAKVSGMTQEYASGVLIVKIPKEIKPAGKGKTK
jgi:HSP20 family protein